MKIFSERSQSRLEPPFFAWRAGSGTLAIRSRMAPISFVNRPIYDKVEENGQVKTTYIRTSTLILHFQLIRSVYATRHCHRHISRWLNPGSGWAFLFAVWDPGKLTFYCKSEQNRIPIAGCKLCLFMYWRVGSSIDLTCLVEMVPA